MSRPHGPRSRGRLPAALLLGAMVALGFAAGVAWSEAGAQQRAPTEGTVQPRPVEVPADLRPEERHTVELFRDASPSVVYITAIGRRIDFWTLNVTEIPEGTGSGFVWDRNGHVVTNFHVVENLARRDSRAVVTLNDHTEWEATLVGAAPEKDLAVVRIDAPVESLRPIAVGSSEGLVVGQSVYAIGNPFGLDQTLTTGVISAVGREIESVTRIPIRDVIQTDAAINPGNSGGPLLDSAGRLIGVNTAIYSPSGAYAGVGFAIPVDTVNWVVSDLINYGGIQRPSLGITSDDRVSRRFLEGRGVLVLRVEPGSGADDAGLRPTRRTRGGRIILGDVIVAVDGERVRRSGEIDLILEDKQPGDTVVLTIARDGDTRDVEVRLDAPG